MYVSTTQWDSYLGPVCLTYDAIAAMNFIAVYRT